MTFSRKRTHAIVSEALLTYAAVLPTARLHTARELLENAEPNEALIQVAWGLHDANIQISAADRQLFLSAVGDVRDLPESINLTGPAY
jgi:hypothetical protein